MVAFLFYERWRQHGPSPLTPALYEQSCVPNPSSGQMHVGRTYEVPRDVAVQNKVDPSSDLVNAAMARIPCSAFEAAHMCYVPNPRSLVGCATVLFFFDCADAPKSPTWGVYLILGLISVASLCRLRRAVL